MWRFFMFSVFVGACSDPVAVTPSCSLMESAYQPSELPDNGEMMLCPDADVEMVPLGAVCGYPLRWIPHALDGPALLQSCKAEGLNTVDALTVGDGCGVPESVEGGLTIIYACVGKGTTED